MTTSDDRFLTSGLSFEVTDDSARTVRRKPGRNPEIDALYDALASGKTVVVPAVNWSSRRGKAVLACLHYRARRSNPPKAVRFRSRHDGMVLWVEERTR